MATHQRQLLQPDRIPATAFESRQPQLRRRCQLAYDALQTIRAARSAGSVTPDSGTQGRTALAQALNSSNFTANGATGAIRFLPSGDRNDTVVLVKVQPGSRSGTGYDFVPLR